MRGRAEDRQTAADAEDAAFEQLYRATRRDILSYLLRRLSDREDAADLLAEVYVVAWRRRADQPAQARPWLFGVARLVLADHRRAHVRHRAAADGLRSLLRDSDPSGPNVSLAPDGDDGLSVRTALSTLSEIDRELITLTIWDGLSGAEAGTAVGISSGAARVRLHRARNRLRRQLGTVPDGSPPVPESTSELPSYLDYLDDASPLAGTYVTNHPL